MQKPLNKDKSLKKIKMKETMLEIQFDDSGDYFILLWRDKNGDVHITGPGTFHSNDLVVLNVPPINGKLCAVIKKKVN
jgi:hypothetical protein